MSQVLAPARVPPPGRVLSRELKAREWTQKDLAEIMGRPAQTINEIIKGNKKITPVTAIELSAALGTSAEFWSSLEAHYRLHLAKKETDDAQRADEIARKSRLYSLAPVSEMQKRGWIAPTITVAELEAQICQFFNIDNLADSPKIAANLRQSEGHISHAPDKMAWVQRVSNIVAEQSVAPFNRKKLEVAIPDILSCALAVDRVALLPEKLLSLGVHFAIVPHLSKGHLDGAAFYLGEQPVIALTLRHKRIDNFWFTLMHELGHIVAGHQGGYLDDMENLAVNQEEEEANRLASNWLISSELLTTFVNESTPYFSAKKIEAFAQSQHRHPGIVVGRLQRDKIIPYSNLRKFLVTVHTHLDAWVDC